MVINGRARICQIRQNGLRPFRAFYAGREKKVEEQVETVFHRETCSFEADLNYNNAALASRLEPMFTAK